LLFIIRIGLFPLYSVYYFYNRTPMISKELLITFFHKTRSPLGFRDISDLLGLSPSERRKMKRFLRELTDEGKIIRTKKNLYGSAEEMSLVTGYFEAHKDGYGFVISEKPGERDIFVPARAAMGAMDDDRVVARIENKHRREGSIVRILERTRTRIVGTFEISRSGFFVKPKNRSVTFDLFIPSKETGKARDGDSVSAEITNYPGEKRPAMGRILKVLKRPETPQEETDAIIEEFNLDRKFPRRVTDEAKTLYSPVPIPPLKKGDKRGFERKDLRPLPTVTIDGERAKDFDDAISIVRTDGGYKLWVHIADVGHYVKWDSAIDIEARKRGTSVYFTDTVIPMLPKELSEDLCSLRPKVDRLAFTVEMDFDDSGRRTGSRFYPSLIHSNERMTYTTVKAIIVDKDPEESRKYEYLLPDFELMETLCKILKDVRLKRGSLDFDLPEPEVLLDLQGNPEAIIRTERNFAHMLIEEFMIAANEAVAEFLEQSGVPSLYRIHEEPDPMKLDDIIRVLTSIGIIRDRKGIKSGDFSGLLEKIKDTPQEEIINHMVLRSLKQAKYSTVNIGHFGLASESYTHFTSPIRRYPDLVVHRILREVLTNKSLSNDRIRELETMLPDIAFNSSRTERLADEAERSVLNAMRVWFMKDKVGEEFEGKVASVTPYGLKIRLKDYYVEGFLHVSYMTDDYYQYDEKTLSLSGLNKKRRYTIGDLIRVRIDRVDMEAREIVMGI